MIYFVLDQLHIAVNTRKFFLHELGSNEYPKVCSIEKNKQSYEFLRKIAKPSTKEIFEQTMPVKHLVHALYKVEYLANLEGEDVELKHKFPINS